MASALYIYKTPEHKELMIRRCGVNPESPTWGADNDKIRGVTFMNRDDAIMDAEWGSISSRQYQLVKFSEEQYSGNDVNLIISFYIERTDTSHTPKNPKPIEKIKAKNTKKKTEFQKLQRKFSLLDNAMQKACEHIVGLNRQIEGLQTIAQERKQTIDALSAEKGKLLRKLGRS